MGFEPTTLRDLVTLVDHGGSWVQIPSGARIFSEFSKHLIYHVFVVSSLICSVQRTKFKCSGSKLYKLVRM